MKLDHILTPYIHTHTHTHTHTSERLKNLYIRHDTIKFLQVNTGKMFSDLNCSNILLDQSSKVEEIKTKINK